MATERATVTPPMIIKLIKSTKHHMSLMDHNNHLFFSNTRHKTFPLSNETKQNNIIKKQCTDPLEDMNLSIKN
jgi:hypothetical protein